jgi:hypothetical protein
MRRRHPGVTSPSLARQCRPRIGGPWQVVLLAVEVRLRTGARIDPGRRLDGGDVPARSTLTGPSPGFRIATVMIRRWPAWVHRRPRWPDGTPARCWIRPAGGCRARSRAASDTRSRRRVSSTAPPSPRAVLRGARWLPGYTDRLCAGDVRLRQPLPLNQYRNPVNWQAHHRARCRRSRAAPLPWRCRIPFGLNAPSRRAPSRRTVCGHQDAGDAPLRGHPHAAANRG